MDRKLLEENLCTKAVWYYYFGDMTQQQIADKLGLSRIKVVRLLEQAKRKGIVQFRITPENQKILDLENQMMDRFGLDDIFLVPSVEDNPNENVARAAACYIEEKLPESGFINIGYGDTVKRILNNLCIPSELDISLIALTGGINYYVRYSEFVNKGTSIDMHSRLHLIASPLVVSSAETAQALRKEPSIRQVFDMTKQAKMTVVSIGSVTQQATMLTEGTLTQEDMTWLRMKNAAGDVLGNYVDHDGNPVDFPLRERMVASTLDDLREMKNVIGVSGGLIKAQGIAGALRSGIFNVLISDVETAKKVLEITA